MIYLIGQVKTALEMAEIEAPIQETVIHYLEQLSNPDADTLVNDDQVIDLIFEAIERISGITKEKIQSHRRTHPLRVYRHIATYLIKLNTKLVLKDIGNNIMNGRDHTTVLNSIRNVKNIIDSKDVFLPELREIEGIFKAQLLKIKMGG